MRSVDGEEIASETTGPAGTGPISLLTRCGDSCGDDRPELQLTPPKRVQRRECRPPVTLGTKVSRHAQPPAPRLSASQDQRTRSCPELER